MAGPSTESLAEQLDRVRDQMVLVKDEIQAARREGLDGSSRLGDIFAGQLQDVRENLVEGSFQLRKELGTGMEALKVEQALFRESLARLETNSDATISRIDRTHEFLKQLLFWFVGSVVTVGGGIFWKASQAVSRIEEHGRRIESLEKKTDDNQAKLRESIEKANDNQTKLRESFDKAFEKTNDNQAKAIENQAKAIEYQARLRESLDKANDNQAEIRDSFNAIRKTLDGRLPALPRPQP